MKNKKVTFVSGDADWMGLYVDGKLVLENHSLNIEDVLDALEIDFEHPTFDSEWMEEQGTLPEFLKDVVTIDD